MIRARLALCLFLAACAPEAPGDTIPWTIERVVDGDTVAAGGYRIRLLGIQAPELRGVCEAEKALGRQARDRLAEIIAAGRVVELRRGPPGKYSQLTAWLVIDGEDAGQRLIAEGLAVPYQGGTRPGWCGQQNTARTDPRRKV